MKSLILLWVLSMASTSVHAQLQHTDWREQGLKGGVRKITTYVYTGGKKSDGRWQPSQEGGFDVQITYFYSASGQLDSTFHLVNAPQGDSVIQFRTIYHYLRGKKTGYDRYEHQLLKETASFTWVDSVNYTTRITYPDNEESIHIWQTLAPGGRELRSEMRQFDAGGKIVFCSSYENKIKADEIIAVLYKDCDTGAVTEKDYVYQQYDEKGNPVFIVLLSKNAPTPEQIWIRTIEYY